MKAWGARSRGPRAGMLLRAIGRCVSPAGARARLLVLIYHRVLPAADPLQPGEVTLDAFRWQMETVARCFRVLPLGEAVERLREGTLPARAAAITFDDGYADNHELALPVLDRLGLPATFFVTTGRLGRWMWNDAVIEAVRAARRPVDASALNLGRLGVSGATERLATLRRILGTLKEMPREPRDAEVERLVEQAGAALPEGLMMSRGQLRALHAAGMELGAHTVSHPILAHATPEEARAEIADSRAALEAIADAPVWLFAYPNGRPGIDYTTEHVRLVAELGFRGAVSTQWGANLTGRADPYQLRRFTPWDATPERFAARLLAQCARRSARADGVASPIVGQGA